jgi:hypothetical protein
MTRILLAVLLSLSGCQMPLRDAVAGQSDEWFLLVTQLQAQQHRLSKPHRQFLSEMANLMASGDDAMPSATQQKWLLTIKRRLEENKK